MIKNIFILALLFLSPMFGVAQSESAEKEVEVRKLEFDENGKLKNGSLPDSLDRKYFFHENGKIYKHFKSYEMAVAHFRGYYPRERDGTVKDVVYISSSPAVEGDAPDRFMVTRKQWEETIKGDKQ